MSQPRLTRREFHMPKFTRNHQADSNALFPTATIIELTREQGVDFGSGHPEERIRYLIKLGLLPHQIRKSNSSLSTLTLNSSAPVGHLPYWTINRLKEIDQLFKKGGTFPQIAARLPATSFPNPIPPPPTANNSWLSLIRLAPAILVITISLLALSYIGLTTAAPPTSVLGVNTVCPVSK